MQLNKLVSTEFVSMLHLSIAAVAKVAIVAMKFRTK